MKRYRKLRKGEHLCVGDFWEKDLPIDKESRLIGEPFDGHGFCYRPIKPKPQEKELLKGYRKVKVDEIIFKGDVWVNPKINKIMHEVRGSIGEPLSAEIYYHLYRKTDPKLPEPKNCLVFGNSYIASVHSSFVDGNWYWKIIGINGKEVMRSKWYAKKSYATNRMKAFCSKVAGVRYENNI